MSPARLASLVGIGGKPGDQFIELLCCQRLSATITSGCVGSTITGSQSLSISSLSEKTAS